jgi:hypothetical protein
VPVAVNPTQELRILAARASAVSKRKRMWLVLGIAAGAWVAIAGVFLYWHAQYLNQQQASMPPDSRQQEKMDWKPDKPAAVDIDWKSIAPHLRINDREDSDRTNLLNSYTYWPSSERQKGTRISLKNKLIELKAYSKDGKVYDAAGKELYFYRMPEWTVAWRNWGSNFKDGLPVPPHPLERAETNIAELEKTCLVIRMYVGDGPKD